MKKKRSFLNYLTFGLIGKAVIIGALSQTPQGTQVVDNISSDVKQRYSIHYNKNFIEGSLSDIKKYSSIYEKLQPESKDFLNYLSKISTKTLEEKEVNYIINYFVKLNTEILSLIRTDNPDLYNRNLQIFYNNYFLTLHNSTLDYLQQIYGNKYSSINLWQKLSKRNQ